MVLLTTLIVLAASQIFMRNVLNTGVIWADELLRILVLWVALLGAVAASRDDKQIRLDVFSRFLPPAGKLVAEIVADLFTAIVCGVIAWYSFVFVREAYQYEDVLLGSLPAWIFQSVLPLAFFLISYRYLLFFVKRLVALIKKDYPQ